MKKFISLAIVLALVISLAAMPVAAASFTEAMGEGNRFYNAVKYMEDNGIFQESDLNGTDANAWLQGDATRIEYATWLARFAGAELNAPAAQAEGATYTLDAAAVLADAAHKDPIAEGTVYADFFTIVGTKAIAQVSGSDYSILVDKKEQVAIEFTVSGDAELSFVFSSTGSSNESQVAVKDASGNYIADVNGETVLSVTGTFKAAVTASYALTAGTYQIVSNKDFGARGARVYSVTVTEAASGSESTDLIFPDMEAYVGTEAYAAVEWGVANGYIAGYKDGTFRPDRPISREEMCALIARYFRANNWSGLEPTDNITLFVDQDEFSAYTTSEQNVVDCVKYGLITGRECGRFDAKHWENGETVYTSRQQVAAIFYRASGNPLYTTKLYAELACEGGVFSARVNEHYTVVLTFPKGEVSVSKVTVTGEVGPLPSIGLDGKYAGSKIVSTGINEKLDLSNFLGNCYTFAGATVNVDIAGNSFTYDVWPAEIDENGNTTVVFMASNACDARAAWNALADVASVSSNDQGSYAVLTNGSSLQVGEYIAEFNRGADDWTVTEFNGTEALWDEFEEKINIDQDTDAKIELILENGITAAYGSRAVILNSDVTVSVDGIYAYELGEALYALTDRNADLQQAGMDLIDAVDALFGELSGATVDVTVEIG